MSDSWTVDERNAIAVVGMAGRFPGAADVDEFWRNLRDGVESIVFFTDEELDAAGVDAETYGRPNYVRARAPLNGVELFDAALFGISPREAEMMDPQHRIFLECALEALENAGYDSERYEGAIGIFGGTNPSTYLGILYSNPERIRSFGVTNTMLANDKDFLTTRVAYKLNLRGPAVTVQTACSTSLVAAHLACQSLLNGECDLALAGGVGLNLPERSGYTYEQHGISSPDGHCRAFDAQAQGTVAGSGVGMVVLKRLVPARADGDSILAVIRGTAINNDGSLKVSFTAPSVKAQARVVAEALGVARVEPDTVGFVEGHGTGTALGDPVEAAALARVFQSRTARRGFCALGSVKTNIGHLDSAAGIAGLIKTIQSLRHGQVPPTLHFRTPNPQIDFASSPFFVNNALIDWPLPDRPRRAGVTSLGIGGTNVHMVLEEAPPPQPSGSSRTAHLLVLSANTATALEAATDRMARYLREHPDASLADVAYTCQTGRRVWPHRRALVVRDPMEAAEALESRSSTVASLFSEVRERPVCFLFSGRESEVAAGIGADLYRNEETFREQVDLCAGILAGLLGLDLRRHMLAESSGPPELSRAALFTIEYALARLWMEWGVAPRVMLGQGVGEFVAACLAGVVPLESALRLVVEGARLPRIPENDALPYAIFSEADLELLLQEPETLLLEVGPGDGLASAIQAHPARRPEQIVLSSLRPGSVLGALGQLWLAGVPVDWKGFHRRERRRRLALPTYPFERQRYWVDRVQPPPAATVVDRLARKTTIEEWLYSPEWIRSNLQGDLAGSGSTKRCWLLLLDELGCGEDLARILAAAGQDVVRVRQGEAWNSEGEQSFTLDPGRKEHYSRLLGALAAAGRYPDRGLHLWSLTEPGSAATLDRESPWFYSLLFLAEACGQQSASHPVELTVIINRTQPVSGEEALNPGAATLLGLCKVIPQEYPDIGCRLIDVAVPPGESPARSLLAERLFLELSREGGASVVAHRGASRWVQTFRPVTPATPGESGSRLKEGGVYLVTGGMGRIGLELAADLARSVRPKLVLLGRTALPPRQEWDAWIAACGDDEPISRKLLRLMEIERQGAEVLPLAADVADLEGLRSALNAARERFGAVHGVFHAAGTVEEGTGPIQELEPRNCAALFRPKLGGLAALAEVFRDEPLDFLVVFSSLAAVLGGLGFGAYAAANAGVDALVHELRRTTRIPCLSVDWDAWRFEETEPGNGMGARLVELAMSPREGIDTLKHIMALGTGPQVIVSTSDLQARIDQWVGSAALRQEDGPAGGAPARHARPWLMTPYVAPRNQLEEILVDLWQELLGIEPVGIHDNFFSLGGHSLLGIQLNARLRQTFEVDLPLRVLFKSPTVAELAEVIEYALIGDIEQLSDSEAESLLSPE